jgi:hypothetical protein
MVTFYVVASAAGGAAMGAVLGTVGSLLPGVGSRRSLIVAVLAAAVAVVLDARGQPPSLRRQVDETWLHRYRDWVCGTGFGAQLGFGAVTIVTSASLYLTWLLELLVASSAAGAVIGVVFGAARAVPILGNRHVVDAPSLRRSHQRWQHALRLVKPLTIAAEAAAGLALLLDVST